MYSSKETFYKTGLSIYICDVSAYFRFSYMYSYSRNINIVLLYRPMVLWSYNGVSFKLDTVFHALVTNTIKCIGPWVENICDFFYERLQFKETILGILKI